MVKKSHASKQDNQAFYWFRRNAIQTNHQLNTVGRMLLQMALLQPYRMASRTQAKGFGVSVDTARRARRIAVKPFEYKGLTLPLFEKKGKEYVKTEVEDWNERFNACPYLNTYLRTVTLRVDLASVVTEGKAYGSARSFADMINVHPDAVRDALHDNEALDRTLFEIETYTGGRHSYRPRLELVAGAYEKKVKKLDKRKPDKQMARYILETKFDMHGKRAKEFIESYIVPAQRLGLSGTYEKLVKSVAKLYKDLAAKRKAAAHPPHTYYPGDIITMYLQWVSEQTYTIQPSIDVLAIKAGWFGQFCSEQSGREQYNIITGETVLARY